MFYFEYNLQNLNNGLILNIIFRKILIIIYKKNGSDKQRIIHLFM